jgi:hypothetical protein
MKTRGRRHNSGSKRHTRRNKSGNYFLRKFMKGGDPEVDNHPVSGTTSVCDENSKNCWFVVPEEFPASAGLDENGKIMWKTFISFFRDGLKGALVADTILNYNMQPDVEMLSASPVLQSQVSETPALETPVSQVSETPVSETPVSETPQAENLTGLESSSTSSQGSEELTADQLLSGGRKRRIRRY